MRGLLKGYADRGGTVLLSSHLLNEVELIADEMVLIGRGKSVAQGDKKSLLADRSVTINVCSLDNERLASALRDRGFDVTVAGEGLSVTVAPVEVGHVAAEQGLGADRPSGPTAGLEDLFSPAPATPSARTYPKEPWHEYDRIRDTFPHGGYRHLLDPAGADEPAGAQ